jgi:hypothetical protein
MEMGIDEVKGQQRQSPTVGQNGAGRGPPLDRRRRNNPTISQAAHHMKTKGGHHAACIVMGADELRIFSSRVSKQRFWNPKRSF